jgi:uncharacterized coiled-coil DUF342 family protein
MNVGEIRDYLEIIGLLFAWIVAAAVQWRRQTSKINGLGRRVKAVEEACSGSAGRMDRMENELREYRAEARETSNKLARVEKSVEAVGEEVTQGNVALGVKLDNIQKLIHEKDLRTQTRLVRMETVQKIEQKVGPLPTE